MVFIFYVDATGQLIQQKMLVERLMKEDVHF